MGWVGNATTLALYLPGNNPVPFLYEAGWVSGPVWTSGENFIPIGIRSPERPTSSELISTVSFRQILNFLFGGLRYDSCRAEEFSAYEAKLRTYYCAF